MSSDDQSDRQCPLCMETLELDDINFFPCKCEYQICWFCWHRIRTDENGLCPACRQPYAEEPANFQAVSSADILKSKNEKRMKAQQGKNKKMSAEAKKHLSAYRVLQKNLLYVVGLPGRFVDMEAAKKNDFFGRFGKVVKLATSLGVNGNMNACSAYITYQRDEEALRAIQAVHNSVVDGRTLKASLGTTKYCASFLRNLNCQKVDCMYLHEIADMEVSFTKEDMHAGKHAEYERRLLDEFARIAKQRSTTSFANAANGPPSTSIDHKCSVKEATIITDAAYPAISSHSKPPRPTPPPTIIVKENRQTPTSEHAGREENGVRNEQDQEVAEILAEPLPDSPSPTSERSITPSESESESNEQYDEASPVEEDEEEEQFIVNNVEKIEKEEKVSPLPEAPEEAPQVVPDVPAAVPSVVEAAPVAPLENEIEHRISPTVVKRPACPAPPGFPIPMQPVPLNKCFANGAVDELRKGIPPPPGLSKPTNASTVLSLLNKQNLANDNTEHHKVQAPQTQAPPDWQKMLGLFTNGEQSEQTQDDDLGFDPFQESAKALAALVAQETHRERSDSYSRQALEAKLELHHQRPISKPVAPPPGFGYANESSQKFFDNDSIFNSASRHSHSQQSHAQSRPSQAQRPYPENSLLADIFSSVSNGNHGRPAHDPPHGLSDRMQNHTQSHSNLFDDSYNRYSQPQRSHVSTSHLQQINHRDRHHMYPDEAMEYRRRQQQQQEQLHRQQEQMHYRNEERLRYQNQLNNSEYGNSRGHQRGAAPPGFAESRSSLWNGSQSHSIMPGYRDLLGNGEKISSSRAEQNDYMKISDPQAGLRALLPNVNVRFVETADENPPLGQYHNVQDRHDRMSTYHQQHSSSMIPPYSRSSQGGYGRASPKLGNSANSYGHDQQGSQWLPPPPGFSAIPRH